MNESDFPRRGRLAGIDYGTVRIGVAVSTPDQTFASPHETYTRKSPQADWEYFRRLAKHEELVGFVVGLPVHAAGHDSAKSLEARRFAEGLTAATGLPVAFFDERYTSLEAEQMLEQAGLTSKRRKERIDMLAAQLILSGFLESKSRGATDPGSLG